MAYKEVSAIPDTKYFIPVNSMFRNGFFCLCKQTCLSTPWKAWSERTMEKACR
jgi:hypothetical protein